MIKNNNKQYAVSFEVVTYRNGELDSVKQTFCTMSGEVNRETLGKRASHIIKAGKREEYEMVHGSCFGNRVTIERKLGNILNVSEIDEVATDYNHAYAEDSHYNYNG